VSSEHEPGAAGATPPTNGNGNGNGAAEWARLQRVALIAGGVGLVIFVALGLLQIGQTDGKRQFFLSYLTAWVFWLSLPVGCLAWLGLTQLTGASWGVLLTRFFEAATRTIGLMALLFVPLAASVFIADASPYPWSKKAEEVIPEANADAIHELQQKFNDWCNPPGFVIRAVIYFAIWIILIHLMNKWSKRVEETNDVRARRSAEAMSGPLVMAFAVTNIFAATDFVMSLELTWSSTMFPLIYCINQLLTCLCFSVAVFLTLAPQPPLKNVLRPKFQLDMGSMMLALTMVWSYMSFAQYLLVWIGNLPEEIPFFIKRTRGGWEYAARALCVLHFALPFLLLLFRDVKLHPKRLRSMGILIVTMCALDVIWWIEPVYPRENFPVFLFMDIAAIVGIGGIWGWMFIAQLKKMPLVPTNYIGQLPKGHDHDH
jgi:hypothetical protein